MVELERRGLPTAAVATQPFVDEALEQARLLVRRVGLEQAAGALGHI